METEKELIGYLRDKDIYIYGAGKNAKWLSERMKKNRIVPSGYIVTKKEGNPSQINGKKVWEAKGAACSGLDLCKMTVVIAIAGRNLDLVDNLLDLGFKNILLLPQELFCEMRERELVEEYNKTQSDHVLELDYPSIEKRHIAVIEKRTGQALFRTRWESGAETRLKEYCSRGSFERIYGPYHKLPCTKEGERSDDTARTDGIEIYVVTSHLNTKKELMVNAEKGDILIQAGAALTSGRMGCLTDDTGDHISERNQDYCECTALYWIWKNTAGQDYVGLSQYRRRFKLGWDSIRYMREQDIDVVAILPQFNASTNEEFFSEYGLRHDWGYMKEAVIRYDAAYKAILDRYERSHFFIPCNMAILKRAWFDRYCQFAFTVAGEIDDRYKTILVLPRKDRFMGYLFENLLSIFLIRHHEQMKIAYTDMEFIG